MKAIVTGAGGFLGNHLKSFLYKKNIEVFNIGTKKQSHSHFIELKDFTDISFFRNTILSIKPDFIFHLAGTADSKDTCKSFEVNTTFCSSILEALKSDYNISKTKILIVGSASEYGLVSEDKLPLKEDFNGQPISDYGISKLQQTQYALESQKDLRNLVIVRPFTRIGPDMPTHLAIGSFQSQIKSIESRGTIRTGNLDVYRDFIDVKDVVNIMFSLINNNYSYGEIVNICRSEPFSLRKVVEFMIRHSKKDITLQEDLSRHKKNDAKTHFGCNKKLFSILGKYQFRKIDDTLRSLI